MQLESFVAGRWQAGHGTGVALRDATTGEVIANATAAVAFTTRAVTMPNMPWGPSAWLRMWQCQTHVPTSVACTSTVTRWPGATSTVSSISGVARVNPSRAMIICGISCRCIGWIIWPSLK